MAARTSMAAKVSQSIMISACARGNGKAPNRKDMARKTDAGRSCMAAKRLHVYAINQPNSNASGARHGCGEIVAEGEPTELKRRRARPALVQIYRPVHRGGAGTRHPALDDRAD